MQGHATAALRVYAVVTFSRAAARIGQDVAAIHDPDLRAVVDAFAAEVLQQLATDLTDILRQPFTGYPGSTPP